MAFKLAVVSHDASFLSEYYSTAYKIQRGYKDATVFHSIILNLIAKLSIQTFDNFIAFKIPRF